MKTKGRSQSKNIEDRRKIKKQRDPSWKLMDLEYLKLYPRGTKKSRYGANKVAAKPNKPK